MSWKVVFRVFCNWNSQAWSRCLSTRHIVIWLELKYISRFANEQSVKIKLDKLFFNPGRGKHFLSCLIYFSLFPHSKCIDIVQTFTCSFPYLISFNAVPTLYSNEIIGVMSHVALWIQIHYMGCFSNHNHSSCLHHLQARHCNLPSLCSTIFS